jgi:hypothetical protein
MAARLIERKEIPSHTFQDYNFAMAAGVGSRG